VGKHDPVLGTPEMKRPATGTTVTGQMVTPTGLEDAEGSRVSRLLIVPSDDAPGSTQPTVASDQSHQAALPSPVPSFLEACAKLAGEAAARGDFVRARELIEKAARVAELQQRAG